MKKETWTITINRPDETSLKDIRDFIKDALENWGGQFHIDDPLFFSLRPVTSIKRVKK